MQIFITCAGTRWRRRIHHGSTVSARQPPRHIKKWRFCSDGRWLAPAAAGFNLPQLPTDRASPLFFLFFILLLSILLAVAESMVVVVVGGWGY